MAKSQFGSITITEFRWLVQLATDITGGSFAYSGTGSDLGHGARYIDGINQMVWYGPQGGRNSASAYYFGALMEWTRLTGKTLTTDVVERLQAIAFKGAHARKGLWHAWEGQGRNTATERWREKFTCQVSNDEGRKFLVRILPASESGLGDKYGPTVRVYDLSYTGTFGWLGQFTGASAYMIDLIHKDNVEGGGWVLDGGVPVWRLSNQNMRDLNRWFRRWLDLNHEPNEVQDWNENARTNFWWA